MDRGIPNKQRHPAKRIYEGLRDEHGFAGKYTIVKDYVRERTRRTREMFVPLSHSPGHAQCDFGEAMVVIGGVQRKAHYFAMDLPHSDECYLKDYLDDTTAAFCDCNWSVIKGKYLPLHIQGKKFGVLKIGSYLKYSTGL